MTEEVDIQAIAQKGREDLFFFSKYILGYSDLEEHPHDTVMCNWIYEVLKRPRDLQNGLNKCPRGTFKSTIFTISFACWILVQDGSNPLIPVYGPDERILIDSETFTKAALYLDAIKGHLRDDYFQSLYGDMISGSSRDREGELIVTTRKKTLKEGTIEASGVGKAKTGMHYDWIFFDDLVSANNIQTQDQLQKVYQHFVLSFALLDPGGRVFVNGTSWHQDDCYIHIENDMPNEFLIEVHDSVNSDLVDILTEKPRTLFFPQRLTWEYLKRQRNILGPSNFAAQYRNQPLPSEEQIFKEDYFQYNGDLMDATQDRNIPDPCHIFMAVDPSMGENPGNDGTGIVIIAVDVENRWHLLEAIQERMEPHSMCQMVIDFCRQYEPMAVVFERLGVGKGLAKMLEDMAESQGVAIPFEEDPVSSNTAKTVRIQSMEPLFASKRFFFPCDGHLSLFEGYKKLHDLLLEFRTDRRPKKCDVMDALSMLINVAAPPTKFARKKRVKSRFDYMDHEEDGYDPDSEYYDDPIAEITGVSNG